MKESKIFLFSQVCVGHAALHPLLVFFGNISITRSTWYCVCWCRIEIICVAAVVVAVDANSSTDFAVEK